jgi:glycosyltransferase involved in cell wall biosynthesis
MEVSRGVDRFTLLLGKADEDFDIQRYLNLEIVEVGFRRGNYPYNAMKVSLVANKLSKYSSNVVFHDTGGYLLPLFILRRIKKGKVFVSSFFNIAGLVRLYVWQDFHFLKMLRFTETRRALFVEFTQKILCLLCDKIILQASGNSELLRKGVNVKKSKIYILRNNFDHHFWRPSSYREKQKIETIQLLYAGPICFYKGIYCLIDVCNKLNMLGLSFSLTIVGDWLWRFDEERSLQMIHDFNLVDFITFIPRIGRTKLRGFYRNSDLLLYQTQNEGSPRVVLEAIGCGLPIISSNHPGILEMDPKQSYINFTDYGDGKKIVEIIMDYRDNPEAFIARADAGRSYAIANFSTPAIARDYIDFYSSLAKG